VQAAGVVLLDDEPVLAGLGRRAAAGQGLRRTPGVALAPVFVEPVGHISIVARSPVNYTRVILSYPCARLSGMYAERASRLPHVVAWHSLAPPGGQDVRVLPDGCLDIIWAEGHVFVAGPDTTAQLTTPPPGSRTFALRFAAGTGPAVIGAPADEVLDRQVPLEDLWPAAEVRRLAEADDPMAALEAAALRRWHEPDPAMVQVFAQARADRPVDAIADSCGLSPRHLLRRCTLTFGYGPKALARILRLQRAVAMARAGTPFATVSATAGYADQAHLSRDVKALAGVPLGTLITPAS
jgi:AraC-like DNA-binding protein